MKRGRAVGALVLLFCHCIGELPLAHARAGAAEAIAATGGMPADASSTPRVPESETASERELGRGMLASVARLEKIGRRAIAGERPHAAHVARILEIAERPWPFGETGTRFGVVRSGPGIYEKHCVKLDHGTRRILRRAGSALFARALAYNVTGREHLAREARELVLDFTDSYGFERVDGRADYSGSNQCALDLSLFVPLYVETAILLESFPHWSASDRRTVRRWLADTVYPVTAAIARTRKNNWGTAAAFASWAIGHYLKGSDLMLAESYPVARVLTPAEARRAHVRTQLKIVGNEWRGDSRCDRFGIQPHGGIPNELRRGSTGCDGTYLLRRDRSYDYQIMTLSHLIFHAEALRRHGGNELYELRLPGDRPALRAAIDFVVDNPSGTSHGWKIHELGVLRVANGYFDDPALCDQIGQGREQAFQEGYYMPFTRLTHSQVCRP